MPRRGARPSPPAAAAAAAASPHGVCAPLRGRGLVCRAHTGITGEAGSHSESRGSGKGVWQGDREGNVLGGRARGPTGAHAAPRAGRRAAGCVAGRRATDGGVQLHAWGAMAAEKYTWDGARGGFLVGWRVQLQTSLRGGLPTYAGVWETGTLLRGSLRSYLLRRGRVYMGAPAAKGAGQGVQKKLPAMPRGRGGRRARLRPRRPACVRSKAPKAKGKPAARGPHQAPKAQVV
jgi:hypothetical protein